MSVFSIEVGCIHALDAAYNMLLSLDHMCLIQSEVEVLFGNCCSGIKQQTIAKFNKWASLSVTPLLYLPRQVGGVRSNSGSLASNSFPLQS